MNCKKCNARIADNALYCSNCGDRTAEHAQKEKIQALKKRIMGILKEQLRSPLFLILAICISIIAIFQIIGAFNNFSNLSSGGLEALMLLFNVMLSVFCILSMIGTWKLYFSSNDAVNAKDIGLFAFYPRVQRVIAVMINIFAGISSGFLLLGGFIGGSIMSSIGDFSNNLSDSADSVEGGSSVADTFSGIAQLAEMGGAVMIIFSILIAAVIMFVAISHGRAWRKMVKLISAMNEVSMGNNYPKFEKKPSCVGLYIWGSIFGICSVGLLALGASFVDVLSGIATGVYMFVFALFFQAFHAKEEANRAQLAKENAKLEEINAEIDSKLRREERERHAAGEAKMQQMMMAMMMNNMSQNKNGGMQDMMKAINKQLQGNSPKTGK